MGGVVSSIVDGLDDAAGKRQTALDATNSLVELAESQHEIYREKILNDAKATAEKLVPIDTILNSTYDVRAKVSSDAEDLGDDIGQVVSQFASGEFLQGIKTIVGRGLKVLMGSYSGSIAKKENYLVSVGPLGGVFRIDYFLYSYRFQSEQLKKDVDNVLLYSIVVSSVDLKALNRNTINVILQSKYGDLVGPDGKAAVNLQEMREMIWKEVQLAKGIVQP
ncbi:hypothetical protein N2152v2_002308 [Parachlorella kessleri]